MEKNDKNVEIVFRCPFIIQPNFLKIQSTAYPK